MLMELQHSFHTFRFILFIFLYFTFFFLSSDVYALILNKLQKGTPHNTEFSM